MVYVIIPAAGAGLRMGGTVKKQYRNLHGRPILAWTVDLFSKHPAVAGVVVAAPPGEEEQVRSLLNQHISTDNVQVVAGGHDRQASVYSALQIVPPECQVVLVHDGVRPLVSSQVINEVIDAADKGAVSTARPMQDTVKVCENGRVVETLDRSKIWSIQTPQGFPRKLLVKAHTQATSERATDDCTLVERLGAPVQIVVGNAENIKITTPADLVYAESLLAQSVESKESFPGVGLGYDAHRLVAGRRLVLGGVEIPYTSGLLGHSDADVLLHAIMEAIIGAAGLGDIGQHFPDTSPDYAGASSLALLGEVQSKLSRVGLQTKGVDAIVIAEQPRISPHIPAMRRAIAKALGLALECVNIKATTNEQMGFIGRQEGIAAQAVATVCRA